MQRPTANVRHRRQKTDPNIGGKPTPAHRSAPSTTPAGTDVNHERVVNGRDIDPFAVVLNLKARLSRVEGTSNVASKRSRCAPSDSAHSRKKVSSEREQFRCDRLGDSVPKVEEPHHMGRFAQTSAKGCGIVCQVSHVQDRQGVRGHVGKLPTTGDGGGRVSYRETRGLAAGVHAGPIIEVCPVRSVKS